MKKTMKYVDGELVFMQEHDRDEFIGIVNTLYDRLEDKDKKIYVLEERLKRPTDEALAEAHEIIAALREENKKLQRDSLYMLSESDREKSHRFWEEHRKTCAGKGRYMEWIVTGTGLGMCLEYKCKHCGEGIDLTDIDSW